MSPATIAIVSVLIFVLLICAVKIVVGKVLHDKDRSKRPLCHAWRPLSDQG